ncbi:MAG: YHYH domain-containing protein [Clostridia bacterium]|nr:YHYH domain-containing protein [Clostridia bacterium]
MKCNNKKIFMTIILSVILIFTGSITFAHSGRTDSNGGHKDNQNKSGLGSYHYHCGGNPPHLHTNGVCPYSSSSSSSSSSEVSSSKSSSSSSKSSSTKSTISTSSSDVKATSAKPTTIEATGIVINESLTNIEVGESKKLTATISPTDTTDKNILWKSSDEDIAVITSLGELVTRKSGTVKITASTSNGKESTIKITVEEVKKENNIIQEKTKSNKINNTTNTSSEDSNPIAGIAGLGLLGGGCYLGFKKYKKSKQ